jgi:hypothetical protein
MIEVNPTPEATAISLSSNSIKIPMSRFLLHYLAAILLIGIHM